MSKVCPNINSPEWKALENEVGRFEAFRDFMENNGEIRSPEAVRNKIDLREFTPTPLTEADTSDLPLGTPEWNTLAGVANQDRDVRRESLTSASVNRSAAQELANKMSNTLGIDHEFITPEQAEEITRKADNPWKGQTSFFHGGKVYFLEDRLTTKMVFHEFSHPFVRNLYNENRELFDKRYQELANTAEGQAIIEKVRADYPNLDSAMFQEEVLVRALTDAAQRQLNQTSLTPTFAKFIKNLLYNIKQSIRKLFGAKSDVANLGMNTTMDELAEMLVKGGKIELDVAKVSEGNVVAYLRDQDEYIDDMSSVPQSEVQALINRAYEISTQHIDMLMGREEFGELANILTDEYNRGELQELRTRVKEFQGVVKDMAEKTKSDMEYSQKQVTALVDTIFRLETIMDKTYRHIQDIAKEGETQDNLRKVYYYKHFVDYWSAFADEASAALRDPKNGIPVGSPVAQKIRNISEYTSRITDLTNDIYAEGAKETLYDQLAPLHESIKSRYESMIKSLEDKGAPDKRIDSLHKEYYGVTRAEQTQMNKLQNMKKQGQFLSPQQQNELARLERDASAGIAITPEKIEALLKGEAGDANFFNSYLEGYMYNTDPVVGGLALYVKNHMNEMMAKAQSKFNDFATDMKPLLEKAGYNPRKIGKLGEDIGFVDKISKKDENGNLVEREVWTLLNQFQNYRYDYDLHKENVEKAHQELISTGTDAARAKLAKAQADRQEFMRKYFHQEYVPEYYARHELFEKDAVGHEAKMRRDTIMEQIKMLQASAKTEADELEIADQLDDLWSQYSRLGSQYNLDGTKKEGIELQVAQRISEYNEAGRKFHEYKPRKGVFENALKAYEQELVDAKIRPGTEQFRMARQEWINKNTDVKIKPQFYQRIQDIISEISSILDRYPDAAKIQKERNDIQKEINDLMAGLRDEDGQPDPNKLSKESIQRIAKLQEMKIELNKHAVKASGLNSFDSARLSELHEIKSERKLTSEELKEMQDLYKQKNNQGLSDMESAHLDSLYAELETISERLPTTHYIDAINEFFPSMDTESFHRTHGTHYVTKSNANSFLENYDIISKMRRENKEFKEWFDANHIEIEYWNKAEQQMTSVYRRVDAWSITRPTDPSMMETFTMPNGEVIPGVPSRKYFARVVKPQYRTKRIIGTTVDNKGNWLPKTKEQGAADERYINKDYEALKRDNPALFDVLEKIKEHHLKNQEGLGYKSRLYLDFPRFRKSNLEVLQSKKIKGIAGERVNALTIWAKRVKAFFYGDPDQAQYGMNDKEEFDLVRADMFDNEVTSVPIAGLYDIDKGDVSTDITHTMMRYMLSAERQKQLVKISPQVRAIQSVVNDPRNQIKELDKVNRFNFLNRGIKTYLTKKGAGVRQRAVNNFIAREFEGQRMAGFTKDVPWLNNTANLLFKRASFGFFALNIPSALKNSYGAKFQGMIEAAAGKYMNMGDFQKGNAWSYATMAELSFGGQLYQKGPKSLRQQIVEIFDPVQDRFEEKFGEGLSRTFLKDAASMSWLYNFRKWVELQASLQIFGGMMYNQKLEQTLPDGTTKKVAYINAWELRDGKIQLKEGIDPKYGITYDAEGNIQVGEEFKRKKNQIHQVMNNLQGAYAKFDQPEAQRYLAFRFLSYLRRYFTTMAINRWGFSGRWFDPKPRMNVGEGDLQMGYYVEFLRTAKRTVTSMGKHLAYMTKDEKRAAIKVMTEVMSLIAINMLMGAVFGWDPDDDEKYEKLRAKSGALPWPLTSEDDAREFNTWGFLENHALHLMMNVRAENEQFLPFPGYGLDDYSAMLDLKSIAFGPTVQTYKEMFEDVYDMAAGNEQAYYKRDVGPYYWQQEGGSKLWAHMGRTVGLTGSSLDPAKAIKGFQSVQARAR